MVFKYFLNATNFNVLLSLDLYSCKRHIRNFYLICSFCLKKIHTFFFVLPNSFMSENNVLDLSILPP